MPIEHSARPARRQPAVELLRGEDHVQRARAQSPATRRCRWSGAGLKAIYLSGWQVAADANTAGAMYPDQSLYPANAGPELCRRINRTLQRADQIEHLEGGAHSATGSRRSSPTPKPASADR